MKKKFMTPLVFVVITSIFVFTGLGYSNINNEAKELGKKELSKYLVECNKSWYIKRVTAGPVELRREGIIFLNVIPLTESDKLNGFEFKGKLVFSYYGPSRLYDKRNTKWAQWKESSYVIDIFIIKKNDEWLTKISKDLFRGGTYTGITCNEVPAVWVKIDENYKPKNGIEELIKNDLSLSGRLPGYIRYLGSNAEIFSSFQGKNFVYGSTESSIKERYPNLKDWMIVYLKFKSENGQGFRVDLYIMLNGKWIVGDSGGIVQRATQEMMIKYQNQMREKMEIERKDISKINLKESKAFLAENKEKEGVVTLESGLQYKVLKEGTGPFPKATDKVKIHYVGTLINGTEFDSSIKRGGPIIFSVTVVIPGWTEALQLMKVGSKWNLFIPPELAYGEIGAGNLIGPNAALIFEIELISIEK